MDYIHVLVCILFAGLSGSTTPSEEPPSCVTPNGKQGICVELEQCDSIQAILNRPPLKKDHVVYVQRAQLQCANELNDQLVCCQSSNRTMAVCKYPTISRMIRRAVPNDEDANDRSLDANIEDPLPKMCGNQGDSNRIIHGTLAQIDEFPWMALLKYKTDHGEGYGCGGALISRRYVLTAAHCTVGRFGPPISVTLGEYDVDTEMDCTNLLGFEECAAPIQQIPVEQIIKYPEYVQEASNRLHDIALIRMEKPASYNDFLQPICIPTMTIHKEMVTSYPHMDVAGWGKTKHRPASNVKRKAKVPIVDRATCSANRTVKIAETQICAGGGKQDTCSGDSGGPLMGIHPENNQVRWYVAGIVSFGPRSCGLKGIASVYTRVASYHDWIVKNMKP